MHKNYTPPIGYGLWTKGEGFFSLEGFCRNPQHAEMRTDLPAIMVLRNSNKLRLGSKVVRFFEAKNNAIPDISRSWEIIPDRDLPQPVATAGDDAVPT